MTSHWIIYALSLLKILLAIVTSIVIIFTAAWTRETR